MKKQFNLLMTALSFVLLNQMMTAQISLTWAKTMGGSATELGRSVAVDALANVYTTGYFTGTADFDPGVGVYTLTASGQDVFVCKLDANGTFVWAKQLGGSGNDYGYGVTVDASGNVYTTGYFQNTADFDPGPGTYTIASLGNEDIFLSKLDGSGAFMWAKSFGGTSSDLGFSIAVDAIGNVYSTGYFQNTVDFDPGAGVYNLVSSGNFDVFVSKLDATGAFTWAKNMGGASNEEGRGIAVDPSGNVYTTGVFFGTADFDPGAGIYMLTPVGNNDVYVSKLDALGTFVWAKQFGGTSNETSNSIGVDGSGNVYTTGSYVGSVDFDPGPGTYSLTSVGSSDSFVSKLDAVGVFIWAKSLGGSGYEDAHSLSLDAAGDVYTSGMFTGTVDFDPDAGIYNVVSPGFNANYISKLNSAGSFMWAVGIGGATTVQAMYVAVDATSFYATGGFGSPTDFDPSGSVFTINPAGASDIFALKLCVLPPQPGAISGSVNVCTGSAALYSINPVAGAVSYSWTLPSGWPGTSSTTLISTGAGASGNITVSAVNACGASLPQTLSVTTSPNITIASSATLICIGQTATLTGNGAVTYTWNPGGPGASTVINPTTSANYQVAGTGVNGCTTTAYVNIIVVTCAGTAELQEEKDLGLTLFPNPNSGSFKIRINDEIKNGELILINSHGERIYEQKISQGSNEIKTADLPPGIYFIRLRDEKNNIVTKKLIVE